MKRRAPYWTDAIDVASEGTVLGPKVTVDLEGMCSGQNLEAALALLLEERLLKVCPQS
jgi:hypothetical protein